MFFAKLSGLGRRRQRWQAQQAMRSLGVIVTKSGQSTLSRMAMHPPIWAGRSVDATADFFTRPHVIQTLIVLFP